MVPGQFNPVKGEVIFGQPGRQNKDEFSSKSGMTGRDQIFKQVGSDQKNIKAVLRWK